MMERKSKLNSGVTRPDTSLKQSVPETTDTSSRFTRSRTYSLNLYSAGQPRYPLQAPQKSTGNKNYPPSSRPQAARKIYNTVTVPPVSKPCSVPVSPVSLSRSFSRSPSVASSSSGESAHEDKDSARRLIQNLVTIFSQTRSPGKTMDSGAIVVKKEKADFNGDLSGEFLAAQTSNQAADYPIQKEEPDQICYLPNDFQESMCTTEMEEDLPHTFHTPVGSPQPLCLQSVVKQESTAQSENLNQQEESLPSVAQQLSTVQFERLHSADKLKHTEPFESLTQQELDSAQLQCLAQQEDSLPTVIKQEVCTDQSEDREIEETRSNSTSLVNTQGSYKDYVHLAVTDVKELSEYSDRSNSTSTVIITPSPREDPVVTAGHVDLYNCSNPTSSVNALNSYANVVPVAGKREAKERLESELCSFSKSATPQSSSEISTGAVENIESSTSPVTIARLAEDSASEGWAKATGLPDLCESVFPVGVPSSSIHTTDGSELTKEPDSENCDHSKLANSVNTGSSSEVLAGFGELKDRSNFEEHCNLPSNTTSTATAQSPSKDTVQAIGKGGFEKQLDSNYSLIRTQNPPQDSILISDKGELEKQSHSESTSATSTHSLSEDSSSGGPLKSQSDSEVGSVRKASPTGQQRDCTERDTPISPTVCPMDLSSNSDSSNCDFILSIPLKKKSVAWSAHSQTVEGSNDVTTQNKPLPLSIDVPPVSRFTEDDEVYLLSPPSENGFTPPQSPPTENLNNATPLVSPPVENIVVPLSSEPVVPTMYSPLVEAFVANDVSPSEPAEVDPTEKQESPDSHVQEEESPDNCVQELPDSPVHLKQVSRDHHPLEEELPMSHFVQKEQKSPVDLVQEEVSPDSHMQEEQGSREQEKLPPIEPDNSAESAVFPETLDVTIHPLPRSNHPTIPTSPLEDVGVVTDDYPPSVEGVVSSEVMAEISSEGTLSAQEEEFEPPPAKRKGQRSQKTKNRKKGERERASKARQLVAKVCNVCVCVCVCVCVLGWVDVLCVCVFCKTCVCCKTYQVITHNLFPCAIKAYLF